MRELGSVLYGQSVSQLSINRVTSEVLIRYVYIYNIFSGENVLAKFAHELNFFPCDIYVISS